MASNMWKGLPELHIAIRRGQFHDARQLVSAGDDVNSGDGNHRTPLILCALLEQATWGVGIARMLLEMGALVGIPDKQGRNALIYACIYRRLELVEIFLRAVDFDLNHRDRFGNTALFYAASSGNADIVTEMVKKLKHFGEKLDRGNKCGMTPLLEACRLGHKMVARMLVENGASEEQRDSVRHWNAMDWEQEHERQLEAADRTRNRSYDKPWLAEKKKQSNSSAPGKLRRAVSLSGVPDDGSQGLSDGGDSSSAASTTDGGSTPRRARCVGLRRLTRANTMSALPNINSAKVVGLTRTWTDESNMNKELITAKFYPSPVPFSNPSLTTDAEKTHNAYGQWRMTQNLRPVESRGAPGCQSDRAAWQGEFRQIFKRYEHQVTESFRKKAKVNPVCSNNFRLQSQFSVNPSIAIEDDRKAPSSRLSRRQSFLDTGQLKRLSNVNSIDTASVSSRRTSAAVGGHGLKGKRDPESSTSSVDSNAAAKMVMNAFRRRKSIAFSSSSSIGKGSLDEDADSRSVNNGIDKASSIGTHNTPRTRTASLSSSIAGNTIADGNK